MGTSCEHHFRAESLFVKCLSTALSGVSVLVAVEEGAGRSPVCFLKDMTWLMSPSGDRLSYFGLQRLQ
jgi:hypothetical protein